MDHLKKRNKKKEFQVSENKARQISKMIIISTIEIK